MYSPRIICSDVTGNAIAFDNGMFNEIHATLLVPTSQLNRSPSALEDEKSNP